MSEREYIDLCKRHISDRYMIGADNQWRQRDFETLIRVVKEKSGISLSLSTIKRIWKNDFDKIPHLTTLDALVSALDYNSWFDFKKSNRQVKNVGASKSFSYYAIPGVLLLGAILIVGFLVIEPKDATSIPQRAREVKAHGPVTFAANKTKSFGVPNTVIFKYNVENIDADSFYLQQSWNEVHRVPIDPTAGNYSSTYYVPGFHRAKLLANDSIFKTSRIHIQTRNWLPLVKYSRDDLIPIYLRDPQILKGGNMSITVDQLRQAGVDLSKQFITSYHNVQAFGISSNNFRLNTRVKSDSLGNYPCPQISITILCEEHIFYVPLTTLGCVGNIGVKFGEVIEDASNSDLSAFGRDIYQWQNLTIEVSDKNAKVMLKNEPIYNSVFSQDFGEVVGLVLNFTGTGTVDYVELLGPDNKLILKNSFI